MLNENCLKTFLFAFKNIDEIEWVCYTCYNNLKSYKVPASAVANGMVLLPNSPELCITEFVERFLSPRIPFMQVVEKTLWRPKYLRGNVVNDP